MARTQARTDTRAHPARAHQRVVPPVSKDAVRTAQAAAHPELTDLAK
ncbi:hypothetical protein OHB14_18645 [Streptomyces sp. NBC_01613]